MPDFIDLATGTVARDTWQIVGADDAAIGAGADTAVLPLADWLARGALASRVWLAPDADVNLLRGRVAALELIALHMPKAADGRVFSQAALLRGRLGFGGTLRVFGDVLIDQLLALRRVGVASVVLPAHRMQQRKAITRALKAFSDAYQGAHDNPLPAWRRHLRPSAEPSR